MIRLQFSTSLELSSALIRRMCHSPFSHLDCVMPDGNLLGASNSVRAPCIEGNASGVAIRPPDYQPFGTRRMAVLAIRGADPDIERNFYAVLKGELGKPFDDSALYTFLDDALGTSRDWRLPDKWFCSELIAHALETAKFFPYDLVIPKNRVSPADLLLLLNPFMNVRTFWMPIDGVKMGAHEK